MEQANTEKREHTIVREFNAPRELVFKAWSEAERLRQWRAPGGFEIEVLKLDFRPGGIFHYSIRGNGQEMWGLFAYKQIVVPERIEFVLSFSDKDGNVVAAPVLDGKWPAEMLNVVTFTEHDGKTTVTIKGGPLNATEEQLKVYADNLSGMEDGYGGSFGKLDAYLAILTNK
ncbi:MAG: polyketide cyclase [Flavipsychrobacter sp.]|nr:polyketide cyclase [Flavipsychrobacter sp.]